MWPPWLRRRRWLFPRGKGACPVAQIAHPQEALQVPPRCIPVLPLLGLPRRSRGGR